MCKSDTFRFQIYDFVINVLFRLYCIWNDDFVKNVSFIYILYPKWCFCDKKRVAVQVQQRSCSLTGLCYTYPSFQLWIYDYVKNMQFKYYCFRKAILSTTCHFGMNCILNDAFVNNASFLHILFPKWCFCQKWVILASYLLLMYLYLE
jgi:hypothetical protein